MGNIRAVLIFLTAVLYALFHVFSFSPAVGAGTIYVGPGGNCGGKTPCIDAIQAGIAMTDEDLHLSICQGTYIEEIAFPTSSTHRKRTFDCADTVVVDGGITVLDGEAILQSGTFVVQDQGLVPVAVPDVSNLEIAAAESAIVEAGLVVGIEANRGSDTVEENHVIGQSPAAEVMMAPEMPVDLVVSLGAFSCDTPDVIGMRQDDAQEAVSDAGLFLGDVAEQYSEEVPAGHVINQNPLPGTEIDWDDPVSLLVSLGPGGGGPPPGPVDQASEIDRTVSTAMIASCEFLYAGNDPVQKGVAPGAIEARRIAVLRGFVYDGTGGPLSEASVSVANHPEFGHTLTRGDGMFDLAVNGGGSIAVHYEKEGFLPVRRKIQVPWQDYERLPDVVLIPKDTATTVVDLTGAAMQVARGSALSDGDGFRQATLLVPPGTGAEMVMPDGSVQEVDTLTVSATEYTLGESGPAAMPAELPSQTGYTYCVEWAAEEVQAAGADRLLFSQPLFQYLENFLGFPVGGIVPVGYYDWQKDVWTPSENGLVVEILGVTGGKADLDVDGSGNPADPQTLSDLGFTDAEREQLAVLYLPDQSLWRIPVTHFSTWDANWGIGLPLDAVPPVLELLDWIFDYLKDDPEPCQVGGTDIECQNQILGETVDVAGTPFTLTYQSNRVTGRQADYTLDIPLSGDSVPASLVRIDLQIEIAGQIHMQSFDPLPDQHYTFEWDGKDDYGRELMGTHRVVVKVGYVYGGEYREPANMEKAFSYRGSGTTLSISSREEVAMWQEWKTSLGPWDARSQGIGGWTLDVHHVYDPVGRVLYPGYGGRRKADESQGIIDTVAGGGLDNCYEGCTASDLKMDRPYGVALAPDGAVYLADTFRSKIRVVRPDGTAETVAPEEIFNGPEDVALDSMGNLYIADAKNHRIVRVASDGSIEDFAGTGVAGFGGDGGQAMDAQFRSPACLVSAPDGSLYVSDYGNHRIRRIAPDGIVQTIAGDGTAGFAGDGGFAVDARLNGPGGIDASPDGSIVFADEGNKRIRLIGPDGIISTVSGGGSQTFTDGLQATDINMKVGWPIFGSDGSIYHTAVDHRVCRVAANGVITTVAGYRIGGGSGFSGDGGPAPAAEVSLPLGKALGHSGDLYVADRNNNRLRQVKLPFPFFLNDAITIPSEDGSMLHRFDAFGRHLDTIHALTGALIYEFAYDENGLLIGVEDGDGNLTTIERDAAGKPLAIVAPFGQRTELSLDANGWLASVTNPEDDTWHAAYTEKGLMTSFQDPENQTSTFTYHEDGRLQKDENASEGCKELNRVEGEKMFSVDLATAENLESQYKTEVLDDNRKVKTITFPDGTQNQSVEQTDGKTTVSFADGMVAETVEGPDPRFGMQSPVVESRTLRTPGGLIHQTDSEYQGVFEDAADPTTLTSLTIESTVNGQVFTRVYDAAARTWTATTPENRQTVATLDAKGRLSSYQATDIANVGLAYDSLGRVETLSFGTRDVDFSYDETTGFLQSVTNPLEETSSYSYDAAGRITGLTLPDNSQWEFERDRNGNLKELIEPDGETTHAFAYTPTNLLQTYTSPLDAVETFTYDKDDRLVARQLPSGDSLEWTYDEKGRLSKSKTPEGDHDFVYDAVSGRLTQAVSRDGQQIAYAYDGWLTTRADWTGLISGSVVYTYDNDFRISQINYAGQSLAVTYDNDGLPVGAGSISITRNAANGLVEEIEDGDFSVAYTRNAYGEVATATAVQGATLYDVVTSYDDLGRIAQKTETIGGNTRVWSYQYDSVGRLIEVKRDSTTVESYDYDDTGNRISVTNTLTGVSLDSGDFSYDNDNKLLAAGTTTYGYDADGRLHQAFRNGDTTAYHYNADGTLAAIDLPDGRQISYKHDHLGRRVSRTIDGVRTHAWLYGEGLTPMAEYDGTGSLRTIYIYAGGATPVKMVRSGTTYHIVSDHLGSPRIVVDSAGTVVKQIDFDSFGNVVNDTNPAFDLVFGFASGITDPEHELVRFGYRDYQPSIGRWTAKDPIFFKGGLNLYGYVSNNPVCRVDRKGLQHVGGLCKPSYDSANSEYYWQCRNVWRTLNPIEFALLYVKNQLSGGQCYPGGPKRKVLETRWVYIPNPDDPFGLNNPSKGSNYVDATGFSG